MNKELKNLSDLEALVMKNSFFYLYIFQGIFFTIKEDYNEQGPGESDEEDDENFDDNEAEEKISKEEADELFEEVDEKNRELSSGAEVDDNDEESKGEPIKRKDDKTKVQVSTKELKEDEKPEKEDGDEEDDDDEEEDDDEDEEEEEIDEETRKKIRMEKKALPKKGFPMIIKIYLSKKSCSNNLK